MRTKENIRKLVHKQLIAQLEDDLNGGETLFKKVWKECTYFEGPAVRECIRDIIEWLNQKTSS